jgi:hypothetical protein
MEAVFGESPLFANLKAAGFRQFYHSERPDGTSDQHEGSPDRCPAPECQWPRLKEMVTIESGGRDVTGSLLSKEGSVIEVKTADGALHRGFRETVRRPEWGVYCPHGAKLVEAVPAEHTCRIPKPPCEKSGQLGHLCMDHQEWCRACYREGRKILPWPCKKDGCSEADFDREEREAEEAYYEEMRQSYYG